MKPIRLLSVLGIAALAFAVPYSAGATVKKTGSWPGAEKKIDLEFQGKPSDGLKQLAKEAGWSLVVANGVAVDGSGGDVHVEVDDQPADAVLEALFVGRDVVAHRNGTLITVTPATEGQTGATAVPPVVPTPPIVPTPKVGVTPPVVPTFSVDTAPTPPPVPTVRGEDRNVFGSSLVIHKNEIVHTVTVTGGSLKVEGIITGDLVIAGGSAKLQPGARVVGNATVFGGSLKMEKDSRIDGDVGIAGGSLNRDEGSVVGGKIVDNENGQVSVTANEGEISTNVSSHESGSRLSRFGQAAHSFGQSVTRMALLFVLGCVLLALLSPRMERLRVEIASRPMRSFALGLVSTLLGSIGALVLLTILCISVIGIPVALFAVLAGVIAIYGAIASVLTTFGAAVIGHRTQNPYLHLLLGCAAFLVLSSIPWIGPLVTLAVAMIAIGALIVTRVGGLLERGRTAPPTGLV